MSSMVFNKTLVAGSATAFFAAVLAVSPGEAVPLGSEPVAAAPAKTLYGEYLAGRHAQETRDFQAATKWYELAMAADPDSSELISRTFLMEVCVGHFDRAHALAQRELKLDPSDAVAELVLVLERLEAGNVAGAV